MVAHRTTAVSLLLQVTHHLFDICEDKYDEVGARTDGYMSRGSKEHKVNNIHNEFAAALGAAVCGWVGQLL